MYCNFTAILPQFTAHNFTAIFSALGDRNPPPPRFSGTWYARKLHNQFATSYSSKMESFQMFFDILTIHNNQISYVKDALDALHVFFTLFGCLEGGGSQGGWGTTC